MLITLDTADLCALNSAMRQKSPELSPESAAEFIALGLGFGTHADLIAALELEPDGISRKIVTDELLTDAVRALPWKLEGEDHDEGMIAAVACELFNARKKLKTLDDEDEDGLAFSLSLTHEGGNNFDAAVNFFEDTALTIAVNRGEDDDLVRRLFDRDIDAIQDVLAWHDTDWIADYVAPDDEDLVEGEPEYDPGISLDGRSVQVFKQAVRITSGDEGTAVIEISDDYFQKIAGALEALQPTWAGNAHAVRVVLDLAL